MENAIVSLICITLILVGTVTMTMSSFSSVDMISGSWKQMEDQAQEMRQTEIACVSLLVPGEYGGSRVAITIRNEGGASLSDFNRWDVIVQYEVGNVEWLPFYPHDTSPGWTVDGIFFSGSPEVFEPDILNPGEEMLLILNLDPSVGEGTTNRVMISTPSGVAAEIIFQREGPP